MRLVVLTLPVTIAVGYLLGGRLRNLSAKGLRYPAAGLAGVAAQLVPVRGTTGLVLLIGSIALMLGFVAANWRMDGGRHHLATPEDALVFLADAIPIPAPVHRAVSIGDVVAYAGAMWFIVAGMLRRSNGDEDGSFDRDGDPRLDVAEATT